MDGCEWDRPEASPALLESERLFQTAAVILTLTVTSDGYVHKGRLQYAGHFDGSLLLKGGPGFVGRWTGQMSSIRIQL